MAGTKTGATDADVGAFIAAIESDEKRADAARLVEIMSAKTGCPPKLWGASIIGFGSYHYRYATGHEGDAPLVGFSPRKAEHSIYVMGTIPEGTDALLQRLGKHRMGKACLYVKKRSDIDLMVLEEIIDRSIAWIEREYGRSS